MLNVFAAMKSMISKSKISKTENTTSDINCSVLFKTYFVSFLFYSCCKTPKKEDACCVTSGDIKEIGDWSTLQCEKRNLKGSLLSLLEIVVINIFQNNEIY